MPRSGPGVYAAILLGLLALALVGVALWAGIAASGLSGEAERLRADADRLAAQAQQLTRGADLANQALTDPARTSEVIDHLRPVVEKAFSYNYTDLDSTARAVQENLSGKALCEYEELYSQVKELAPEQKLVLTTQVREIGVTRLEGDRATLLVFVDQRTQSEQNQATASGAQFGLNAERQNSTWKITNIDMLGQPLPNGQPAPQC